MNTKNVLIGVAVIVVLGLGVTFPRNNPVVNQIVGSVTSNEFTETPTFNGGISGVQQEFMSTTTIACMVRNPIPGYARFDASFRTTATTTTTVLAYATSTAAGRWATSTITAIGTHTVTASAAGQSTLVGKTDNDIVASGEYVNLWYTNGTTLGDVAQKQSGVCNVLFYKI